MTLEPARQSHDGTNCETEELGAEAVLDFERWFGEIDEFVGETCRELNEINRQLTQSSRPPAASAGTREVRTETRIKHDNQVPNNMAPADRLESLKRQLQKQINSVSALRENEDQAKRAADVPDRAQANERT